MNSLDITKERILRQRHVVEKTGLARATIYAKIKCNSFPKQIKIGLRSVGWLESEIDAWITNQTQYSRKN